MNVDFYAKKLWDYLRLNDSLEKSDIILVLCSHDLRVAKYATELFNENYAPIIAFTGGIAHAGDLLETPWEKPEAEMFAEEAIKLGVPKEKIIIENKATNSGENVRFTKKILEERNIEFNKIIIVQKPYMERRALATAKLYWPEKEIILTSPPISYEEYPNEKINKETLINIMVGDLQRIKKYPEKGYQVKMDIPEDIWETYEELIKMGYDKHLSHN